MYIVEKITLIHENGNHSWTNAITQLYIEVDNKPFDSGSTKHVYKLYIDGNVYAAKRFYFLGNDETKNAIPYDDNLKHLKEELVRQHIVSLIAHKFQSTCEGDNITTYDVEVEKAHILRVCEGPDMGLSWIVAPMLDHTKMKKFSGTDKAGTNTSLAGRTCDALAHFSLYDSGNDLVFVDVQGIKSTTSKSDVIVLFDLMMHSAQCWCGLGDHGVPGIKTFISQHKCNDICRAMGLPKPSHNPGLSTAITSRISAVDHVMRENSRSLSPYTPESTQIQQVISEQPDLQEADSAPARNTHSSRKM